MQLECVEISHPNFTKTYYVVRNAVNGITVTHEGGTTHDYEYYPLQISKLETTDDLDSGLQINLGDIGEVLPKELDAIRAADAFHIKPTVRYRAYRSDDLTAPMLGPFRLEVTTFSFAQEGASFDAKAPSINISQTGEIYRIERFTGLRGFL